MIELIGKNVPSSKNSKRWVGNRLIKSKLCLDYEQWALPLLIKQKRKWEKEKEDKEKPLKVSFYFYRDSKRKFDANNVTQILCDLMTKVGYIPDDNVDEMIPVFEGYEVVKKPESGVKFKIIN